MNLSCRGFLLAIIIIINTSLCWAQEILEVATFEVSGRVLSTRGEGIRDVVVQLDLEPKSKNPDNVKTSLQGRFQFEIDPDTIKSKRLQGILIANKDGYLEGRETVDIDLDNDESDIVIVLREGNEDPDQISITTLVSTLAPRLRDDAAKEFSTESDRKEFLRGCEELIDRRHPAEAVLLLNNSVKLIPVCLECRLLLSLAMFDAGSWSSADKQLKQLSQANDERAIKRPEPALIMGALKGWRGLHNDAARLYLSALEADPKNAFALQELGRALVGLKKWENAEEYLEKALQAGAGDAARILRIRALMEIGDVGEAAREMDRYTESRGIKNFSQEARSLSVSVRDHVALLSYKQANPVTTQSPEDLIKALPELQGLEAAADQSMLEEVLKRTGEGVDTFFKSFPNTSSLEQVHQERRAKDGKVQVSLDQEFLYLMLARAESTGLGIEEHRSTTEGLNTSLAGLKKGLMLTSGFTSVSYVFHPLNRSGSDFRYLGKQTLDGHTAHVIAFAQKPETTKMITRFVSDDGNAVILIHGLAWVDTESFHILRLRTDLLNPAPSVRLQRQTTEILFQQVSFDGAASKLWLPQEVNVTVDWRGRLHHNQHRYSDFKLFNIETKEENKTLSKRKGAKPDPPQ
jgi:tetratricopeptide (TPR) repeat protein